MEEVTEPMSSFMDSLPPDQDFDLAKIGSSGQPSSDFQNDSLPPDRKDTISMTSREEVYSMSEVEIFASTWPPGSFQSVESERAFEGLTGHRPPQSDPNNESESSLLPQIE